MGTKLTKGGPVMINFKWQSGSKIIWSNIILGVPVKVFFQMRLTFKSVDFELKWLPPNNMGGINEIGWRPKHEFCFSKEARQIHHPTTPSQERELSIAWVQILTHLEVVGRPGKVNYLHWASVSSSIKGDNKCLTFTSQDCFED